MKETPKFIAGCLALDFHNTVSWHGDNPLSDNVLEDYQDVVDWALDADVVDSESASDLKRAAQSDPDVATAAFERMIEFRHLVHRLFAPVGRGETVPDRALDELNEHLSALPLRLTPANDRYVWSWSARDDDLESVIWPVVWDAGALLRSPDLARVGECDCDTCCWLFVDRSRRHNRKWCQMEVCGNRAKARRHYRRRTRPH